MPTMPSPDPTRICIDIETYGKSEVNRRGDPLPPQTRFHPTTCRLVDRVRQQDLLLTCSITTIQPTSASGDRPSHSTPTSTPTYGPGPTIVLELDRELHRRHLTQWLAASTELWGMNLLYDLTFLRTIPAFKRALAHRPRIVDLGIRNYQHSELRPERSLKNLGPILGLWSYEEEIQHRRFSAGEWPLLLNYNAQDTHNSVLGIIELEKRIRTRWPNTDKLSPWMTDFYSDLIWSVVHIQESGVAFSDHALEALRGEQWAIYMNAYQEARRRGLTLHGEGSATSKNAMMDGIMEAFPELREEEMLAYTPTTHRVSWGGLNRKLLRAKLPAGETQYKLGLMDKHSRAQKLITSYIKPLKEKHLVEVRTSPDRRAPMAFPSWHVFPGPFKDGSGTAGGTQQSRITATAPGFQTNPREIKRCFASRYPEGTLVAADLSQIELRVAGLLSGEPTLLNVYADDLADLHALRAIDVFGAEVTDYPGWRSHDNRTDPRQWAKQFNFADLYRAGVAKLRALLLDETGKLFPEYLIRDVVRRRTALRPILWNWQQDLIRAARRDGYLVLPITGQSRYLDADEDSNTVCNFPIQTTAGNVLHRLKHYVIPRLHSGCRCFGDIYDALVFDHPGREGEAVEEIDGLIQAGVRWLSEHDYWALLQNRHNRTCPLKAETEALAVWSPEDQQQAAEDTPVLPDVQQVRGVTLAR